MLQRIPTSLLGGPGSGSGGETSDRRGQRKPATRPTEQWGCSPRDTSPLISRRRARRTLTAARANRGRIRGADEVAAAAKTLRAPAISSTGLSGEEPSINVERTPAFAETIQYYEFTLDLIVEAESGEEIEVGANGGGFG